MLTNWLLISGWYPARDSEVHRRVGTAPAKSGTIRWPSTQTGQDWTQDRIRKSINHPFKNSRPSQPSTFFPTAGAARKADKTAARRPR